MNVAPEDSEQAAFVEWFRLQFPGVLIFAIPNGAFLNGTAAQRARQMAKLKRAGLVPGIPDLCVPAWSLWIEMKREKGGRLSPAQLGVIGYLRAEGDDVIVAGGWMDAAQKLRAMWPAA